MSFSIFYKKTKLKFIQIESNWRLKVKQHQYIDNYLSENRKYHGEKINTASSFSSKYEE